MEGGLIIRTLLISINITWRYSNLGIDMLASFLRNNNFDVDILYFHQGEALEDIIRKIPLDYDVYGMSVYSSNYYSFLAITNEIKKETHRVVFWGGAFPSMYYMDILKRTKVIDYIILGDGEKPTAYLLKQLENKMFVDSDNIVSVNDFTGKYNACNDVITHHPAWDYYYNVVPEKNFKKIHCIQTKNNICTGMCSFCYERKGKIIYKDIKYIIDEIRFVYDNFGIKKIFFSDDNLLDPNNQLVKERIYELCLEIKKMNLKIVYTCYIKAVSFRDCAYDNRLLELMSEVGFATMFIGIESGNESDLKLYNKLTTVDDNITIVNLLKKHHIIPMIGFINFNPYSTLETLRENYQYLKNIKSVNLFTYACSFLNLSKGTAIYNLVKNDGLLAKEHSITNELAYNFMDKKVTEIVDFLREELMDKINNLEYDSYLLEKKCEESIRFDKTYERYRTEVEKIKESDFLQICDFFGQLYENNNIEYCKNNADKFLTHFENKSKQIKKFFKKIQGN